MNTHTVILRSGERFLCSADQTILEAAFDAGIHLAHSCKTGQCGVCASVCQGDTELLGVETFEGLSSEKILTCTRAPKTNVILESENLTALAQVQRQTLPVKVHSMESAGTDILIVTLRMPPNASLSYLPGQHASIIGPGGLRRSYSFASMAPKENLIEFHIRKVRGGRMSEYWFEKARPNDLLRIEGPVGTFFMRDLRPLHLIFIATGTGIAPIKAMLENIAASPSNHHIKSLSVFWGGRFNFDLYWDPKILQIPVDFYPVLSRAGRGSHYSGYVQEAVLDAGLDLENSVVYACGSPEMIKGASEVLVAKGLSVKNFYSDAFVSS